MRPQEKLFGQIAMSGLGVVIALTDFVTGAHSASQTYMLLICGLSLAFAVEKLRRRD